GAAPHSVNGQCTCDWSHFNPGRFCTHQYAVFLIKKSLALIEQHRPEPPLPDVAPEAEAVPAVAIDPRWIVHVSGRPFIRFEGLLTLAHQRGLLELSTTVVTVSETLAVCQATARFTDGLVVTDVGDATPSNVKKHLAPHFVRMSATRASARALRRALN